MTFALDLRRFAERTGERADAVVRKVVFDVGSSLVLKSPVGDPKYWASPAPEGYVGGRFRANWQYGLGSINKKTTEEIDANGTATISSLEAGVPQDASGRIHYITNSLPYAKRLEEGWSRQAPFGFVGITTLEFNLYVSEAVRNL
jgi:hypothetical protein